MENKETKLFDFTAVEVENIEGKADKVNLSKLIGNTIYSNTRDLGEVEIAREIYKNGRVALTRDQAESVRGYFTSGPYVIRRAIEKTLEF